MNRYLLDHGIKSACVTGEHPRMREEILQLFEEGKINALQRGRVDRGWDAPRTDCIALLRPTKSLGLYVRCVGVA